MDKVKKIISSMIFILIINMFFGTIITKANPSSNYEMSVTYGIEGRHRGIGYTPIIVDFKPLNKEFKGEVEVRVNTDYDNYDAYSTEVIVEKDESMEVIIPVNITEDSGPIAIHLIENGKSVEERRIVISNGRVLEASKLVGVLSDDMNSLSYLGDIRFDDMYGMPNTSLEVVELNPSLLDKRLNIESLDVIIISNYSLASFGDKEFDTLNSWVEKGGALILSTGANESKVLNSINGKLIDIESSGVGNRYVTIGNSMLNLELSELNIRDGQSKSYAGENTLLHSVAKGKGQILVFSFDIGLEPFISSTQSVEYLNTIFQNVIQEVKTNVGDPWNKYMYSGILDSIPIEGVLSSNVVIIVIVIYVLVIGIVLYIVLKKIKKRDLMWVSIPLIACITSGILYLMSSNFRLEEVILNQVNTIEINEEGEGIASANVGIGSKYKNDMVVKKPTDIVMDYSADQDYYYYSDIESTDSERKLRVKTTYTLDDSYFTFENSEALGLKKFNISGKEVQVPKFETDFKLVDGKLNGSFKNNLDTDASKVLLVSGNIVWDLGNVEKGDTIEIVNENSKSTTGFEGYINEIESEYYDYLYGYSEREEKYEGEFEHMGIYIQMLRNQFLDLMSTGEASVIVLTDLEVDYGIEFEDKSVSKYDTTIILQDTEVEFEDENGNLSYPAGYFKGTITTVSNNIHFDDYSGTIYIDGGAIAEIDANYNIDKDINILEIIILEGSDYYGYNYGSGELSLYNYKTGNYDSIGESYLENGGYKIESVSDYIDENMLNIRMKTEEDMIVMPDIIVKGERK